MVLGIILIISGLLIAIYPQLLSFIVAFILIFSGLIFVYLGYYYRKASRTFDDPLINFFFRL